MAKVGNHVKVNIRGATLHGFEDSTKVNVGRDTTMSVSGTIVEDLGHSWLIELEISLGDKNRIVLPKDVEVSRS